MSEADALRAKLDRLDGAARARPLLDLAQVLADGYWRDNPGRPESKPLLDEAIEALDEAYGYFAVDDGMRGNVAGLRGMLYGARYTGHLTVPEDRAIGIEQLEQAVQAPNQPPVVLLNLWLSLGQLYLSRATDLIRSPDFMSSVVFGDLPAGMAADVDRATACFERMLASPAGVPASKHAATLFLRMAGALRAVVECGDAAPGADRMNRIMSAITVFQEVHNEQVALVAAGPDARSTAFYRAEEIAGQGPLDRPVPFVQVDDGSGPSTAPDRPAAAATADDPAVLRRELRARVSGGGDLFEALEALLTPAAPAPPADLVDDVVALAIAVADAGRANRTDHLLLATGLCLRARAAGTRWARRDLDDATEALLRAAVGSRPAPPETVRVMRRLAAVIDAADRECRAGERLAGALRGKAGR